ncbi:hypothetical protein GGS23DRAFT_591314 [Durotheca rogersii]|uniref:uncharacterized protein n=1 Tax=Durotheca rogersii TaxID=419775 RepID=UPI00222095B0|nr:uncharacterized protein GGS23DRAFT_591314 [Durotheca rogersii]KAI5852057.1 hypothetical protein GGS23DRAFT_591314 [Durotheca rogersii]
MTGAAPGSQAASQPVPIDAEKNIGEVDMLLGKWTRGGTTWYPVKWKGFHDKDSTWEKRRDIYAELVDESSYEWNHFAIKRLLVEWKGPGGDNSWEKEAGISYVVNVHFRVSVPDVWSSGRAVGSRRPCSLIKAEPCIHWAAMTLGHCSFFSPVLNSNHVST